jgi:hypothetical protein
MAPPGRPQTDPEVPIDPFDGQPVRYRCTDPGYVLYSILEDGQDNGGRERGDVQSGEPYDWCFIVTRSMPVASGSAHGAFVGSGTVQIFFAIRAHWRTITATS